MSEVSINDTCNYIAIQISKSPSVLHQKPLVMACGKTSVSSLYKIDIESYKHKCY